MKDLIFVALAGAAGAVSRWGCNGLVQRYLGSGFAWGTLVVNVLGCLLFGAIFALSQERLLVSPQLRLILLVGFCGSFTTYSTFAFETVQLVRDGQWLYVTGNIALQIILGCAAVLVGLSITRWF